MIKYLSIFSLLFLFAFSADSCPYESMVKIDLAFSTKIRLILILSKRFHIEKSYIQFKR